MKSYSILVIIVTLFLPSGAQLSKKIDQSLAIQCPCENTSICNWYHNNQSVPIHWVQGNGSLLLPANNWSVYGVVIGQCASVNYTYLITNPGESCDLCLQLHFDPVGSEYCLGSVFTVTVSTNLLLTLDDNIILLINDAECSVNDSDKDIVECVNDDSHLYSFILTATNIGAVIIEAHTNYYGADWYSNGKQAIVTECVDNDSSSVSFISQAFVGVISLIVFCISCTCSSIIFLYYKKRKGRSESFHPEGRSQQLSQFSRLDEQCDEISPDLFDVPLYHHRTSLHANSEQFLEETVQERKVINKEKCPLMNCQVISKLFDHNGGELLIKEYAVKITVPVGAIDENCEVQIEAAASPFGPFTFLEQYDPISAYVWIGACYEFKKKLMVEIEHDIVVSEETDLSELLVLTACEEDKYDGENNQVLYNMRKDTCEYHYELNKSTCAFFTSHFCSKCLAATGKAKAKRIIMYHYLPEDYKSEYEFVAEVCFCYDLQFCKERTEERYTKRRMEQESYSFVRIFNWKTDKILLSYSDNFKSWKIYHLGDDEIISEALNFRLWYDNITDLQRDEDTDRFPPRFRLKVVNKDSNPLTMNFVYKYKICIKSNKREDKQLTLNISGFGHRILNKASINPEQPLEFYQHQSTPASSQQKSHAITTQDQSHVVALEPSSPICQQQLQPVLSSASHITNIMYICAKGDNANVTLGSSSHSPTVNLKFNSLWSFADDITNTVNIDVILPMMIREGLVSAGDQQDLSSLLHSMAIKQQRLCSIILALPESCVNKFLHCLFETKHYEPHKQLYDKLKNTDD